MATVTTKGAYTHWTDEQLRSALSHYSDKISLEILSSRPFDRGRAIGILSYRGDVDPNKADQIAHAHALEALKAECNQAVTEASANPETPEGFIARLRGATSQMQMEIALAEYKAGIRVDWAQVAIDAIDQDRDPLHYAEGVLIRLQTGALEPQYIKESFRQTDPTQETLL